MWIARHARLALHCALRTHGTPLSTLSKIVEVLYATVLTEPRASYGTGPQLAVTFAAGYLAGVICAVVSNPADTVVSKVRQERNTCIPSSVG